jgi:SAM-dependent methyltransferase
MGPDELRRQATLEDRHFWYTARRRQVVRRVPRAERVGARALDLGAGSGGNTSLLDRAGYLAVALEHHPVAAQLARTRGLDVLRADAHRLPFADGAFDVVLACDVLEHLEDDGTAVREIGRVLRPGGRLIGTVPADPELWSAHDVALHHVRRYTRTTLTSTLTGQGLLIDSLSAWMVLLRPLVAMRRRRQSGDARVQPAGTDAPVSDLEPVPRPLNVLLGLVLRAEHRLSGLGRSRRGVSLVFVAHKPR